MTPEEKSLLERTYKLADENNSILRAMRRANRIGTAMKILYWVIIIGATVGAFYFLQPYINSMMGIIDEAQKVIQNVGSTTSQAQNAFNSVRYGTK
jgi:TRAP-type C4-dicarboxylate transport system permease small subunit